LKIFGQYLVQHYFAALDGKRFLSSDIAQDLPVLTDMDVSTLARFLKCVAVAVLDLWELLQIICLFYSLCIDLQPHTVSQNVYRLLRLIVYRLNAMITFSHNIPEFQTKSIQAWKK